MIDRILPTINNSILGTAVGWGVTEQGESSAVLREVCINCSLNQTFLWIEIKITIKFLLRLNSI